MAEYNDGFNLTRVASGDMNAVAGAVNINQYCFVGFSGNDVFLADSGALALGVLQNNPKDNEHATVRYAGSTKIRLASSLGSGIEVAAGSGGYAVNAYMAGTLTGSGRIMGLLLTGATSGAVGELLLQRR